MSNILDQLITNRTQSDVSEWLSLRAKGFATMTPEEKTKWMAGMRGSYNAADLNRITSAMVYLKNLYRQFGYAVSYEPLRITHTDGTSDTTWRLADIPTEAQMVAILKSLCDFWGAVESMEATVAAVWENTGFGYVELNTRLSTGAYAVCRKVRGLKTITATIESSQLDSISAQGTGWKIAADTQSIIASYDAPGGAYMNIQDALDALVLFCTASGSGKYADATVRLRATLRSGITVLLGTGTAHWSSVINWSAFEAYAMTWDELESRNLTWAELEALPIPPQGGRT